MYRKCSVIVLVISLFCSCGTIRNGVLLYSDPGEKPYWVDNPPQTDTIVSFSSRSSRCDSEGKARKDAELTALVQVTMYYGVVVQSHSVEHSLFVQSSESIVESSFYETSISSFTSVFLKEISPPKSYYKEVFRDIFFRDRYEVVVLTEISIQKVRDDIRQYSEKISAEYAERIEFVQNHNSSLLSVLREYAGIYTELNNNPILKSASYYGNIHLYDYVISQIDRLIDSFFIDEPETTFKVKENDTIKIQLNVTSLLENIGPFEYRIMLEKIPFSSGTAKASQSKTIGIDNTVFAEIDTRALSPGLYRISFEILLEKIMSMRKNITRSCYVEVVRL